MSQGPSNVEDFNVSLANAERITLIVGEQLAFSTVGVNSNAKIIKALFNQTLNPLIDEMNTVFAHIKAIYAAKTTSLAEDERLLAFQKAAFEELKVFIRKEQLDLQIVKEAHDAQKLAFKEKKAAVQQKEIGVVSREAKVEGEERRLHTQEKNLQATQKSFSDGLAVDKRSLATQTVTLNELKLQVEKEQAEVQGAQLALFTSKKEFDAKKTLYKQKEAALNEREGVVIGHEARLEERELGIYTREEEFKATQKTVLDGLMEEKRSLASQTSLLEALRLEVQVKQAELREAQIALQRDEEERAVFQEAKTAFKREEEGLHAKKVAYKEKNANLNERETDMMTRETRFEERQLQLHTREEDLRANQKIFSDSYKEVRRSLASEKSSLKDLKVEAEKEQSNLQEAQLIFEKEKEEVAAMKKGYEEREAGLNQREVDVARREGVVEEKDLGLKQRETDLIASQGTFAANVEKEKDIRGIDRELLARIQAEIGQAAESTQKAASKREKTENAALQKIYEKVVAVLKQNNQIDANLQEHMDIINGYGFSTLDEVLQDVAGREVGKEIKEKIDAILNKVMQRGDPVAESSDTLPPRPAKRQKLSGDPPTAPVAPVAPAVPGVPSAPAGPAGEPAPGDDIREVVTKTLDQVRMNWDGDDRTQQLKDILVKIMEERPIERKTKLSTILDRCAGQKESCMLCKFRQIPCRLEEQRPCTSCTEEPCLQVTNSKGIKGKRWIFTEISLG